MSPTRPQEPVSPARPDSTEPARPPRPHGEPARRAFGCITRRSGADDPQRGAGLLGTSAGLLVFLLLMFAAVQILFNLYATSMVTSAAYEAARSVAGFDSADNRCAAVPAAEAAFVDSLSGYAAVTDLALTWTCTNPDSVTLRVVADHPTLLPNRLAGLRSLAHLDRTITVRLESPR